MLDNITLVTVIFYGSLSLPILGIFLLTHSWNEQKEKYILQYFATAFVCGIFTLIAFRPVGENGFTDTAMYIQWFNNSKFHNVIETKDIGFGLLIFLTSKFFTIRVFFIICTLLSFGALFWISKVIAGRYWFLFFLGTMVSLYFWNHQVFTIRQGTASLFFLTAIFQKKYNLKILLFIVAISFHKSFLLPFICYFIVTFFTKTNVYIALWCLSILISYFFGKEIGKLFFSLFPENIQYYYSSSTPSVSVMNFRWDVVIYSSIFLILPYFYKCSDKKYVKIVNLYLLTNLFTLLMIWPTDGYIHRFAYLSWFLSPLIAYYPLLLPKKNINFGTYFKVLTFFYLLIIFYVGVKLYKQDYKFVSGAAVTCTTYQINKKIY